MQSESSPQARLDCVCASTDGQSVVAKACLMSNIPHSSTQSHSSACSVVPRCLAPYVQPGRTSKVEVASSVESGKSLNNCRGPVMTFCDIVRVNFGALPGSSLMLRSPPIVSSRSPFTAGECVALGCFDDVASLLTLRGVSPFDADRACTSSRLEEDSRVAAAPSVVSTDISIFSTSVVRLLPLLSRELGMMVTWSGRIERCARCEGCDG
jgi:hypothetical protein